MNILATSDLHGQFPKIEPCDLLLIAGDICPLRHKNLDLRLHYPYAQKEWLITEFMVWCMEQPAKDIVWIAGNHDYACEQIGWRALAKKSFPDNVHYIQDETIEIQGKKIYGMPWVPNLTDWAFYASDFAWEWLPEDIPDDTDILMLHSPPRGAFLDSAASDTGTPEPMFREILDRIKPELVVCGHIHEGYGDREFGTTKMANVAYMDEDYRPTQPPKEFILD